jgi:hypothetical protein
MKKLFFTIGIFLIAITQNSFTQNIGDLNGIYYQAVAIDENGKEIVGMDVNGKPLYNKAIGVRFSITKGLNGQTQWEETHTINTDSYGLFSLIIGNGTATANSSFPRLLDIPWIDADQFLKVEIATRNDGNYKLVSNQQFMAVPYSFYSDDIADDAITTAKILNQTILNEDVATGAIDSRAILDETIINEDVATGAIDSRAILDETIINEDVASGAIDSRAILDETIINEDVATGAIDSRAILDGTIINQDIADGTIDLAAKVSNILAVEHGGTGTASLQDGGLLIGGGANEFRALPQATDGQIPVGVTDADPTLKILSGGTGILINHEADQIIISSSITGGVEADGIQAIDIGAIAPGSTYTSPAFPVPGDGSGTMGDIILASIDKNLQGCMLTPYFFSANTVRIAIFNGTGGVVNLGNGVNVKLLIVQ